MKRLSLFGLLLLAACSIHVNDLGTYWNNGELDPALAGKWRMQEKGKSYDITVVNVGGMYRIDGLEGKPDTDLIKTVRAGRYNFSMTGPRSTYTLFGPVQGDLDRYIVEGDTLQGCNLKVKGLSEFLGEKYPREKNFTARECPQKDSKDMCWEDINIKKLNDEALKILSEIPNNDTYWECGPLFTKVRK